MQASAVEQGLLQITLISYARCLFLLQRWNVTCRYQRGSEVCEKLARSLDHLTGVEERELFDFGRRQVSMKWQFILHHQRCVCIGAGTMLAR